MKALPTKFGQVAQTKKEKGGVDAEGRETPCDGGKQRHGRKRYGNWWLVVVLFWRYCSLLFNLLLTFFVLNVFFDQLPQFCCLQLSVSRFGQRRFLKFIK